MSTIIKPYKEDIANNRPGADLFVWRTVVLFIFFVLAILLFTLQHDTMPLTRKVLASSFSVVLLLMIFYHLYFILVFNKICYDITPDSLTIRSFTVHQRIQFSDIKEVRTLESEALVVKKKKIFSYFREAPQIVYPVAQFGTCMVERLGSVTFYSFVDSLKEPKNVLLLRTRNNKQYALSPVPIDELVNLIGRTGKESNERDRADRPSALTRLCPLQKRPHEFTFL